jgi:hypothetical protein
MDAEVNVEHIEHAAAISFFFSEGLANELRKTAACHQLITEMAIIQKSADSGHDVDPNILKTANEIKKLVSN